MRGRECEHVGEKPNKIKRRDREGRKGVEWREGKGKEECWGHARSSAKALVHARRLDRVRLSEERVRGCERS